MTNTFWDWPALDLGGQPPPARIELERGVWGKVPGAATDYRWIAATASFLTRHAGVEREVNVGSEDAPKRSCYWRSNGEIAYAVTSYPSRARDAAMRGDFIEKQVLAWRRGAALPAALGALLLLPRVAELDDEVWWEHRDRPELREEGLMLEMAPEEPLTGTAGLEEVVAQGLDELRLRLSEESLRDLLAALLAGGRAVALDVGDKPLSGAALAALLLALPRQLADRLSLAGWLPSTRADPEHLARRWDVVAGGSWKHPGPEPSAVHRNEAAQRAEALLEGRPEVAKQIRVSTAASSSDGDEVRIALWGPSAAGKTALIAQLYLFINEDRNGVDWEILPDKTSVAFIEQMRKEMHRNNRFPKATVINTAERIAYRFRNEATGAQAAMVVEDRAGKDFETFHEEARERLQTAQGLVLLFDPTREPAQLEVEVAGTLERVHVSRDAGDKDPRPIAVCVSKADKLVRTPADYEQALKRGEEFVREKVDGVLVRTLDRFCTNYRLFPVSSAGLKRIHGILEPTVFYDEGLNPRLGRGGVPLNLMVPFSWVLDEVAAS